MSVARGMNEDRARFTRPAHLPGVELVSVQYRDRAFPTHVHAEYVVGTVISGAEALIVGRTEHVVAKGDVLRLHPEEAHSNHSLGPDLLRYLVFYLPAQALLPYLDDEAATPSLSFASPQLSDAALSSLMVETHRAMSDTAAGQLEQESAMMALVDALSAASGAAPQARPDGGSAVRIARDWIETHFDQGFGLDDVAQAAGLSAFRLAHLFQDAVGLSPIAYRNQRRVTEARRLLLAGASIADAALQVGFADQSHLTRHFQRIVGTSPRRYLQQ